MKRNSQGKGTNQDLAFLVGLLIAGSAAFQLGAAATGHALTRAQHLGTALEFARTKIDLLRPVIQGFNANGSPTPLDFPVWQGITAILFKWFGSWYGWGNLVSIVIFYSSFWPLYDLVRRHSNARTAWWTLFFVALQPVTILIGGCASADGTAWSFAVWFAYAACRMTADGGWKWWLPAAVMGMLSVLTKPPFFLVAGTTSLLFLLTDQRHSWRSWIQLSTVGLAGAAVLLLWNVHAHRLFAQAEFPLVNVDVLGRSGIRDWYFGTVAMRLRPGTWVRAGWTGMVWIFGNPLLCLLALLGICRGGFKLGWHWLAAAVCGLFIFTPLIMSHAHYQFIYSPAIAMFCAIAAVQVEQQVWLGLGGGVLRRQGFLAALAGALVLSGFEVNHLPLHFDTYYAKVGQSIRDLTPPGEKLVVWGVAWGEPFLHADREGLTGDFNYDASWIDDPAKLARLKALGYTRLVFLNPSPLTVATSQASGMNRVAAVDLTEKVPSVARTWPVLLNTHDVLILEIPK